MRLQERKFGPFVTVRISPHLNCKPERAEVCWAVPIYRRRGPTPDEAEAFAKNLLHAVDYARFTNHEIEQRRLAGTLRARRLGHY